MSFWILTSLLVMVFYLATFDDVYLLHGNFVSLYLVSGMLDTNIEAVGALLPL